MTKKRRGREQGAGERGQTDRQPADAFICTCEATAERPIRRQERKAEPGGWNRAAPHPRAAHQPQHPLRGSTATPQQLQPPSSRREGASEGEPRRVSSPAAHTGGGGVSGGKHPCRIQGRLMGAGHSSGRRCPRGSDWRRRIYTHAGALLSWPLACASTQRSAPCTHARSIV